MARPAGAVAPQTAGRASRRPEPADVADVDPAASPDDSITPAMRQYREQKEQVGDALLLFRMGDFYELFYEDAEIGARLLNIALTSRDNGRTPMAGIPHHALESYLGKLVAAGRKVAISEQLDDARSARGLIRRAIVRIVTPGTLTEETLLDRSSSNLLAAVCRPARPAAGLPRPGAARLGSARSPSARSAAAESALAKATAATSAPPMAAGRHVAAEDLTPVGLAALELSTGEFIVQAVPPDRLLDELIRLGPAEVLLPDDAERLDLPFAQTGRSPADFGAPAAQRRLLEQFQVATLEGFGFREMEPALQAAGALLAYIQETQRGAARHVLPPRRRVLSDHVVLDPVTLRSLEVERTLRTGAREGSLLSAVDRTVNPMGARLLRTWLRYPLRSAAAIAQRSGAVGRLLTESEARAALRQALRAMGDLERQLGKLGVRRVTPRDLRALGDGLATLPAVRAALARLGPEPAFDDHALTGLDELASRLCAALRPDAPLTVREGRIFQTGYSPELDRLRALAEDGQRWLVEFQAREAARVGIPALKVGYTRVFGYYIEISHAQRQSVPPDYVRKQTVKNAERYITDELKRFESEALSAAARIVDLEYDLFIQERDALAVHIPAMQAAAARLAELDVLAGWAELAQERRYSRPEVVESQDDRPLLLEIESGRHPVVEQALDAAFVPNDTRLQAGGPVLALITGPNMAGKSTYIRQVATLVLLAHCGCWTPAARLRFSPVDRIFTRVGASDELARGQSTFMVEMLETAEILHNATRRSLVVLDEIGRGTSTYDGLALAWAITEHLAVHVGCRTLFATHYHELTELAELLEPVFNLTVSVREYEDQVVFLHRITAGAADRSYGVHVARLAGLPTAVLERAHAVLIELERSFSRESQRPVLAAVQRRRTRQLRLFEEPEEQVVRQLRSITPEELSPEESLRLIVAWRRLLGSS